MKNPLPPTRCCWPASTRSRASSTGRREVPARILGILIGTLIVAMLGVIAAQLRGRRVALLAMFGAAIYVPLILVGTYVAKVAEWTTRRMFELGGLDWSRHTASTSASPRGGRTAG